MKPWYEELFSNYARTYDREAYTQGTEAEVDFILQELGSDKAKAILDIGCGTGRHAISLARRGYRVTGVDLSPSQIERAKAKAAAARVAVEFIVGDARQIGYRHAFDLVMLICEGAFPLMETDEMNFLILAKSAQALKEGGKLILTTLCALYPLVHTMKGLEESAGSEASIDSERFDLQTFRFHSTIRSKDDSGRERILQCSERYYAPSEIRWLLLSLGLKPLSISGCQPGRFSRTRPLTPSDLEMLVVAEK